MHMVVQDFQGQVGSILFDVCRYSRFVNYPACLDGSGQIASGAIQGIAVGFFVPGRAEGFFQGLFHRIDA